MRGALWVAPFFVPLGEILIGKKMEGSPQLIHLCYLAVIKS